MSLGLEQQRQFDLSVESVLVQLRENNKIGAYFDSTELPCESQISTSGSVDSPEILIVPGIFHREYPKHDARGIRLYDAATALGFKASILDLPSFCSVSYGATQLERRLEAVPPDKQVLLVSVSKGALDTIRFFRMNSASRLLARISAWVTISGILTGSPLIDFIEGSLTIKSIVKFKMWWNSYAYSDLLDLRWQREIGFLHALNSSFPILHVQGFPRYADLSSKIAKKSVARLFELGVSDGGGTILTDTLEYPGKIFVVDGADHYLSNSNVISLLSQVIRELDPIAKRAKCSD